MESNQIKWNNPIDKVITRYVSLTYKGNTATGLCPFHPDRTPSLHVHLKKQIFTCFSCGEKGDVISFVQKIEKCSFREAIQKLNPVPALDAGPQKNRPLQPGMKEKAGANASPGQARGQGGFDERAISVDKKLVSPNPGHEVFLKTLMPYVSGVPELSPSYLDFEVGIAPQFGNHPMRGRIIFPIRDEEGMLRGFSGRVQTDTAPKYLNTSTKEGYYKSHILYGLHKARKSIEESGMMYIVEGFKDAIAMHAAGFTNTVAICGSFASREQLNLIRRFAGKVFILLDADEAGRKGTAQLEEELKSGSVETVTICLPEDYDPDACFRHLGKEEFQRLIRELSHPPHRLEYLLLTACLMYPGAVLPYPGGEEQAVRLLPGLLEQDGISFAAEKHRTLLEALSEGHLPENLQLIKESLIETYGKEVKELMADWLAVTGEDPARALSDLMQYLLFRYSEARLVGCINELARTFYRIKDTARRWELLGQIEEKKDILSSISQTLNRPGATRLFQ